MTLDYLAKSANVQRSRIEDICAELARSTNLHIVVGDLLLSRFVWLVEVNRNAGLQEIYRLSHGGHCYICRRRRPCDNGTTVATVRSAGIVDERGDRESTR